MSAQEPATSIFEAVRASVAAGRVQKTKQVGFSLGKTKFTELPQDGGVLVGFDVGLGEFARGTPEIHALRPIYRTANGNVYYRTHGPFKDRRVDRRLVRSKVKRTVRLRARHGYAVGAITLRTAINIQGLSLTYMRVDGPWLDPGRSYDSKWVGNDRNGRESFLSGDGAPVVGLFGIENDDDVLALGLIYLEGGRPRRRAALPPVGKSRPRQEAPPEKADAPAEKPPRAEAAPKARKATGTTASPKGEAAPDAPPAQAPSWLPLLGAGLVLGLIALVVLALRGHERIVVVEEGVQAIGWRRTRTIYWGDVVSVREAGARERTVSLADSYGNTITVGGTEEMRPSVEAAIWHAYQKLTPRVLERVVQGETLDFGAVRVSRVGIEGKPGTLAWGDFGDVFVLQGRLAIQDRSGRTWLQAPLEAIINYRALSALAERFVSAEQLDRAVEHSPEERAPSLERWPGRRRQPPREPVEEPPAQEEEIPDLSRIMNGIRLPRP
jgi:hypothetical protein